MTGGLLAASPPNQGCRLLAGPFAWLVQGLLGGLVVLSLLAKRAYEKPKRAWTVWGMDVCKNGASGGCAHLGGMLIALLISNKTTESARQDSDECAWYLITFVTDTSLGVALSWSMLSAVQRLAKARGVQSLAWSGHYGEPPSLAIWATQASSWCLIVIVARICCGVLLYTLTKCCVDLAALAATISRPFKSSPKTFLLVVMLVCPLLLNVLQFLVQDHFLKFHSKTPTDVGQGNATMLEAADDESAGYLAEESLVGVPWAVGRRRK
mmetsp:Transcript_348/g.1157  ORF Transcript_348/g.1157 Transcript_348/m.1157 type:complete len:267 (+) Transcript_348:233-1033(+)